MFHETATRMNKSVWFSESQKVRNLQTNYHASSYFILVHCVAATADPQTAVNLGIMNCTSTVYTPV